MKSWWFCNEKLLLCCYAARNTHFSRALVATGPPVCTNISFFFQNPGENGSGVKMFSFKGLSARLKGEDTSYESQIALAEKDLQEAETNVQKVQKTFE